MLLYLFRDHKEPKVKTVSKESKVFAERSVFEEHQDKKELLETLVKLDHQDQMASKVNKEKLDLSAKEDPKESLEVRVYLDKQETQDKLDDQD